MSIGVASSTTPPSDAKHELEQRASDLEIAAQAFELASAIIRWRLYCENCWCGGELDTFDEPPSPYIETEANLISRIGASMRGGVDRARRDPAFRRLSHALDKADRDFRKCFHSENRRRLIEQYDEIDWEIQTKFGRRRFWLRESPFVRPAYKRFLIAALRVVSDQPTPVAICFRLGLLAASEQNGLLSDLIAREKEISPEGLLQQRISPAVRALVVQLKAFEHRLPLDKFDVGYEFWLQAKTSWGYKCWAQNRLVKLATTLSDMLRRVAAQSSQQTENDRNEPVEASCSPSWRSDMRILSYYGVECKYRRSASRQFELLDRFEQNGWCERVDTPFCNSDGHPVYSRLKNAVDGLNQKCKSFGVSIKFLVEGAEGRFARWQVKSHDGQSGGVHREGTRGPGADRPPEEQVTSSS